MSETAIKSKTIELTYNDEQTHYDLVSGLFYAHSRITFNTQKTLESSAFLYSLIELP